MVLPGFLVFLFTLLILFLLTCAFLLDCFAFCILVFAFVGLLESLPIIFKKISRQEVDWLDWEQVKETALIGAIALIAVAGLSFVLLRFF